MASVVPASRKVAALLRGIGARLHPPAASVTGMCPHRRSPLAVGPGTPLMRTKSSFAAADSGAGASAQSAAGSHENAQAVDRPRQEQQVEVRQPQEAAMRSTPLAPGFGDLLGPWFPGDRTLHQMLNSVDRLFDDMLVPSWVQRPPWPRAGGPAGGLLRGLDPQGSLAVRPPWDVLEDESTYHLRFDLPGMAKEEVEVRVDDDHVLHISAQHKEETKEGNVFQSRVVRRFQTNVQLPEDVKPEDIKAEMKHGVLTVTVPKKAVEEGAGRVISVPIA